MNTETLQMAALNLLPRLQMYYDARRQARWQQQAAAPEHKAVWLAAQMLIDAKIDEQEAQVCAALELNTYKGKRVLDR